MVAAKHCTTGAREMSDGMQKLKTLLFVITLVVLCEVSWAETVRVSFLRDNDALRDTLDILRKNGCTEEALARFEARVSEYFQTGFTLDLRRFPSPNRGFYAFEDVTRLINALPHPLWKTEHTYGLNCFDSVILLANHQLRTALKPNESTAKFFVTTQTTNGIESTEVTTAIEAFTKKYPAWYRDITDYTFPQPLQDVRISLTAAFFRSHSLPDSVKEEHLRVSVLETIRRDCRSQKVSFPRSFEVILKHQVHFPTHTFATTHAGLLFRRGKGYMYLEKAGGAGPFLRADFENRADLVPWLASGFRGLEHEHTHLFATFNDSLIEALQRQTVNPSN
jgi:hypothetical protein